MGFKFDLFVEFIRFKIYQGGIFKRVFVDNIETSYDYITAIRYG